MKVLVVEDNADIQEQLREIIDAIPGTTVVGVCSTSEQAREWMAVHPEEWDLAVIDLFLREGHGFDVLRGCRRRRPEQKAVVLSNYTRHPAPEYAMQAGADAFFDKALDLDKFQAYCARQAGTG
jgi:two-component system OmpR family response regulator